ncbi:hypothetical protein Ade02nite_94570 [Paractinoplanes deccanensis]|uniref:Uncharacterized protein n=1 Tax=Paractinoplanes deccanensis TaxID=113561 RepID=A0ABQ3YLF0_9ACTN|nr:hypothetical protein [Actinoplanes deccanensis]GID80816.1 hypothetical protein Ade02nite_94570 [Actinoplanes deccanensis]
MSAAATVVFLAVVGARFAVPLFIPRYPLPAILAALILDGVDQTIFQAFGYDPPGYQNYDKAMDVYYLAIAYLATLRNWAGMPAVGVARFLYFYRLTGVVLFEFTGWRAILLIFPNTFEYFFIAYEVIRLRWNPDRYGLRYWCLVAAAIWIFVKLPQEWWIHIAQLDVTDTVAAYPVAAALVAVVAAGLAVAVWLWARPRLPRPDWSWHVHADPLPDEVATTPRFVAWVVAHRRVLSAATLEKIVLIGLLSVIFGELLPGLRTTGLQLFLGIAAVVVVNAAVTLWVARGPFRVATMAGAFAARVALNATLVVIAGLLLGRFNWAAAFFFVLLLSLLTLLDDRYRPAYDCRKFRSRDVVISGTAG